ncbi:hypothetical protein SLA_2172 [Streptomyces laurentii]|uniref:Uncharacterized protein n=1 Tax=Streptomyces laurentii TaxID=39478 RepID=A0A160NYB1_STRLU|nr:hypothetical protein SLA_2172 [Streptomyces laurentii]
MSFERNTTTGSRAGGGPTAELRVEIFQSGPGGVFREWVPAFDVAPVRVTVYTESALATAFAGHGPRVAGLLEASSEDTWRITAHCLSTGAVVGEWTWARSEETGRWIPAGDLWCVWDDSLRIAALERANARAAQNGDAA